MELREPKRKRRVRVSLQHPFPILNREVAALPTNRALWQIYTGKYSGDFVVVDAPDEIIMLHNHGFFGKGSLSRANPQFGKTKQGTPPFIRERQWKLRCEWAKQHENMMENFRKQASSMEVDSQEEEEEDDCVMEKQINNKDAENEINTTVKNSDKSSDINCENEKNNEINKTSNKGQRTDTPGDSCADGVKDDEIITLDSAEEDEGNGAGKNKTNNDKNEENEQQGRLEKSKLSYSNTGVKRKRSTDLGCSSSTANNIDDLCLDRTAKEIKKGELSQSQVETSKEKLLLVLPDSESDDEGYLANISPRLEVELFPVHETLHLTLEEAFFLSYALGCLQIIDLFGNYLSIVGMWQLFCKSQKDFVQKYVVYHYFRSKGWVVKPGIKFGGDFLIYKQGPPFYHASYIVLVEVIDSSTWTRLSGHRRTPSWTRIMGLNRLAESAGKEILFCQVIWPSEADAEIMESPAILSKFQVHELLIRRWVSSQEREENDVS